jgi:hypothetical protein
MALFKERESAADHAGLVIFSTFISTGTAEDGTRRPLSSNGQSAGEAGGNCDQLAQAARHERGRDACRTSNVGTDQQQRDEREDRRQKEWTMEIPDLALVGPAG